MKQEISPSENIAQGFIDRGFIPIDPDKEEVFHDYIIKTECIICLKELEIKESYAKAIYPYICRGLQQLKAYIRKREQFMACGADCYRIWKASRDKRAVNIRVDDTRNRKKRGWRQIWALPDKDGVIRKIGGTKYRLPD